eukprot:3462019-Rhodomonas_salina.1
MVAAAWAGRLAGPNPLAPAGWYPGMHRALPGPGMHTGRYRIGIPTYRSIYWSRDSAPDGIRYIEIPRSLKKIDSLPG